jgi:DNA-binding Lrp family transcriptional regulator
VIKAYILGIVGSRSELVSCLEASRRTQFVKESYLIYGAYDLICKVEVEKIEQINVVLDNLFQNGIVDSNTLIVNSSGLNLEKPETHSKRKSAYTFIKIRRPAAPKLWDKFLNSIDAVLEAHEVYGFYDVVVGVSEDARSDFFNSYFKKLWLLTDINLNSTTTTFTVDL